MGQCCTNISINNEKTIETGQNIVESSKNENNLNPNISNEEICLLIELNKRKSLLHQKESYLDFFEANMDLTRKILENKKDEQKIKEIIKDDNEYNEFKQIANQITDLQAVERQKSKESNSSIDLKFDEVYKKKQDKNFSLSEISLKQDPQKDANQKSIAQDSAQKQKIRAQSQPKSTDDSDMYKKHVKTIKKEQSSEEKQEKPDDKKKKQKKVVDWNSGLKIEDIQKVMGKKDGGKHETKTEFDNQSKASFKSQKSTGSQVKGVLKKQYNDSASMYAGDNKSTGGKKKKIKVKWQENYKTGPKRKPKRIKK